MLVKLFFLIFWVRVRFSQDDKFKVVTVGKEYENYEDKYFIHFSHFSNMAAILQKSDQTCKGKSLLEREDIKILNSENSIYDEKQSY